MGNKYLFSVIVFLVILMLPERLHAQAPGGINTNLKLWLKANAGVTTSGTNVTTWADQSGGGMNFLQPTVTSQPLLVNNSINNYPAINFTADVMTRTGGVLGAGTISDVNIYSIVRVNNSTGNTTFLQQPVPGGEVAVYMPFSNTLYWRPRTPDVTIPFASIPNNLQPNLYSFKASTTLGQTYTGIKNAIVVNGKINASGTTMNSFTGSTSNMLLGNGMPNSDIAEVIVYNGAINASQNNQIESYLALKYGITLDQTVAANYVNSAGAILYPSATTHSGYATNIVGIAKDDGSGLNQSNSKSVNNGAVLTVESPAALNNGEYFITGDNGLSLALRSADAPAGYGQRLQRTWRVSKSSNPGTVTLRMFVGDIPELMANPNLATVALLKNSTNSFASAVPITGGTLIGPYNDTIEFTGVSLNDGDYFTLSLGTWVLPPTDFEFWFGVPRWAVGYRSPQKLHFTGASDSQYATYVIDMPADPGFAPIIGTVAPQGSDIIDLTSFINNITVEPANVILNRGLRIRVSGQMGAYYANEQGNNYGTMPLRGPNALGTSFIIPGQNTFNNGGSYPNARALFVVTATQDGTQVTITPSQAIVGHGANVPFNITMNKGQSYSADAVLTTGNHLGGSLVTSNNPVVVTYSDDLLGFGTAADNAGDQLVPVSKLGLQYAHIRANLTNSGERAYIFGSENGTTVTIFDGTTTTTQVVNKGTFVQHLLPAGVMAASIKADKPVMVYKMGGYSDELGGGILTPIADCKGTRLIAFQYATTASQVVFNFVAPDGIVGNFLLNGNSSIVTAADFVSIPGIPGWKYCRKTVTGVFAQGQVVKIENTAGKFYFYQNLYSSAGGGGGDYSNFSDFGNVVLFPKATNVCGTDPITLNSGAIAFNTVITGYSWTGPNGFTSTVANPVIASPTPANIGTYTLTVTDQNNCPYVENVIVDFPVKSITVTPIPSAPCVGSTVQFTSTPTPAEAVPASVNWTGPNGFTSTQANFEITSVTAANAGTYTCTYTDKYGCTISNSTTLAVSPSVVSSFTIAGNNKLSCTSSPITLSVTGFTQGINYETFQPYNALSLFASSDFTQVSEGFYNEQPTNSGVAAQMNLLGLTGITASSNGYGVKYYGFINIITAGSYTFYTSSVDGSNLYIDGSLVVSNDGGHAATEVASSPIVLSVGNHAIEVNYFVAPTSADALTVSYAGPSITKQAIPATRLFYAAGAAPALTYDWSTGATNTPTINVTTPGTYTVTGSNGGCSSIASFTVTSIDSYDYSDSDTPWPVAQAKVKSCVVAGVPSGSNGAVWAGAGISTESTALKNPSATADIFDDGLFSPTSTGGPFTINLSSNTPGTTVYYGVWYDWNNNGDFVDDVDFNGNPAFYSGSGLAGSSVPLAVLPPAGAATLYRSRLIVADIPVVFTAFNDIFENGEVEDYSSILSLSGTVFVDSNALIGTPSNTVDGVGTNLGGLTAILVNNGGNVVANATVAANGTYSFVSLTANTYSIVLSTTAGTIGAAPPAASLPAGWVNTGENLGLTPGNDGTVNGILTGIVLSSISVTNANFGINSRPLANPLTACLVDSGGQIIVPTLTGSDTQDGTYTGISNTNMITIVSLPTVADGILYYNNVAVTAGQIIPNYNPSLLTLDFNPGFYSASFTFNEIDAAGTASSPATVTLSTAYAGPDTSTNQNVPITMAATGTGVWTAQAGNPVSVPPVNIVSPSSPTTQITDFHTDGIYTFIWTNSNGCSDTVLVTVPTVPPIVANDDTGNSVNGFAGGTSLVNVLTNDTLNNVAVVGSDVTTTFMSSTNPGITLSGTTVNVAPGTPAGSYTLVYRICEIIRPTNCDEATVNVTVTAPPIIANDDLGTSVNGASGGTAFTNVLFSNDSVNGVQATLYDGIGTPLPADVNISFVSATHTGIILSGTNVIVAAGTPAGNYTLTYQICEALNPANCDTATVTVTVTSLSVNGTVYNDGAGLNGTPINTINGTGINAGGLTALLVNSLGNVIANATVAADGTYGFTFVPSDTYSIVLNTAPATIGLPAPAPGLFTGWVNTGENLGAGTGNDGTVDGILTAVVVGMANVTEANFGIDNRPVANPVASCVINPGGTIQVNVPVLTGSDAEDGIYTGSSNTNTITIVTLATNGTLYYNGIAVTPGQVIPNYNPTLLTLDPDDGVVTASFTFNEIDAAGVESLAVLVNVSIIPVADAGADFSKTCAVNPTGLAIGAASVVGETYLWTPSAGLSSDTVSNPVANPAVTTTYTLTTTNTASGCSATDTVTVTVDTTTPVADAGADFSKTCALNPTGLAIGSASVMGETYLWTPSAGLSSDTVSNPVANPAVTTTYSLTTTNTASGCSATDTVTVMVDTATPVADAGADFSKTCALNPTGLAIGSASVMGETYLWTPSAGLSSDTVSSPVANPAVTTTYTLTTTNTASGCSATDTVTVTVDTATPVADAGADFSKTCAVNPTGLAIGAAVVIGETYLWTPATGLSSDTLSNPFANPAVTTTYTLTTTNTASGCSATDTVTVMVDTATPVADAGADFSKTCAVNPTGLAIGAASVVGETYLWTPANGLSSDTVSNPVANPAVTTTYSLTTTNTASGCSATDTVTVTVDTATPNAGSDTAIFIGRTITMNATGNGIWTADISNPGTATITTPTNPATMITSFSAVGTYNFIWTTTNGCFDSISVVVTNAIIDAVVDNFSTTAIDGNNGGITPSVLSNDTSNGVPVVSSDVTLTAIGLPPGATLNPDGTISIAPNTPAGNYTVTYTICKILNPTNCNTTTASIVITFQETPGIAVVKGAALNDNNGDGFAQAGETITYNFTITNTGNVTLSNIQVNDPLVTIIGGPIVLAPGAVDTTSFTAIYTLTQGDVEAGTVTNQATVSAVSPTGLIITRNSDSNDPLLGGAEDPTVILLPRDINNPSIAIVKTAHFNDENTDSLAQMGESVTYIFTVINTGNVALSGVVVSDTLTGSVNLAVSPAVLAPGGTGTATASYTITQSDLNTGKVTNTATVTGTTSNGGTVSDISGTAANNDTPTVIALNLKAEFKLSKDGTYQDANNDGKVNIGDHILFTFAVENTGTIPITNIIVTDPMVIVTGGPLASLAPGAIDKTTFKAVYSLTQQDLDIGAVYNSAIADGETAGGNPVTADSKDPSPIDPSDPNYSPACPECTVVSLPQKSGIALVKQAVFYDINNDGITQEGETITYSFTIINTGDVTLTGITVADPLPGIVMHGGPITLLAGETDTKTFTGVYTIKQSDINAGTVVNQATVSGSDASNNIVSDISDNTDKNGNKPTAILLDGCTIKVFNALSINGDGENDTFYIGGIECYPDNDVVIYNRWGIQVYHAKGYDNKQRVFRGYSDGRVTIASDNKLPAGTYFYVLEYKKNDGSVQKKSGYMNLN